MRILTFETRVLQTRKIHWRPHLPGPVRPGSQHLLGPNRQRWKPAFTLKGSLHSLSRENSTQTPNFLGVEKLPTFLKAFIKITECCLSPETAGTSNTQQQEEENSRTEQMLDLSSPAQTVEQPEQPTDTPRNRMRASMIY